jgi:hypothetical protein
MVSVMGGLNANIGGGISAGLFGNNAYYPPMMYNNCATIPNPMQCSSIPGCFWNNMGCINAGY